MAGRMTTDVAVAADVLGAGVRSRTGTGLMGILAVVSFTAATWVALVVVGGTGMLISRWREQPDYLDARISSLDFAEDVLEMYVWLAVCACAILVPAVMTLAANAAVLGATGREERLATLRLLGISRLRASRIALTETMVQAMTGMILGTALSVMTAPLWTSLELQFTPVRPGEMLLPWWGYPLVWLALAVIITVAAVLGLVRVNISPLGVTRRIPSPRLRRVRLVALIAAVLIAFPVISVAAGAKDLLGFSIVAAVMVVVLIALNLAMPFLLQFMAWLTATAVPAVSSQVALRRIQADPKRAWGRVSVVATLAVLLGGIASLPLDVFEQETHYEDVAIITDVISGSFLSVAIGFILTAVSTLLTQSSTVFQSRYLSEALYRVGAPRRFETSVAMQETLGPLIVTTTVGALLGFSFGRMIYSSMGGVDFGGSGMTGAILMLTGGFLLVMIAVIGADALRRRVRRQTLSSRGA